MKFRIVDTRFRILKGGKVSLAASIALVGGMLSVASVGAYASTDVSSTATVYSYTGSTPVDLNVTANGVTINVPGTVVITDTGSSGDTYALHINTNGHTATTISVTGSVGLTQTDSVVLDDYYNKCNKSGWHRSH